MNNEYCFTIINDEGFEVTCDVISMITDKESRIYLLYTDYLLDNNGNFRLLASELVQEKNDFVLKDIEDKEKLTTLVSSAKDLYLQNLNKWERSQDLFLYC